MPYPSSPPRPYNPATPRKFYRAPPAPADIPTRDLKQGLARYFDDSAVKTLHESIKTRRAPKPASLGHNMKRTKPHAPRTRSQFRQLLLLLAGLAGLLLLVSLIPRKPPETKWAAVLTGDQDFLAQAPSPFELPICEDLTVENRFYFRHNMVVTFSVYARTEPENKPVLGPLVEQRSDQIKDRMRRIVATLDPADIRDPKLQTVKARVKSDLDTICGPGLIDKVLIPEWQAFRS